MKKAIMLFVLVFSIVFLNASESDFKGKKISTYLEGMHISIDDAKKTLTDNGFEVIGIYIPVKNGTTLVFTNGDLKKEGTRKGRGHAAVLRMFIDDTAKRISITNPIYFGKAFMQDDYKHKIWENQYNKINKAFPGLKGSKERVAFKDLDSYRFMFGMPYYEDEEEIAEGNQDKLIAKAKKGKVVFEVKLSDKSTLIGYELSDKTKGFVETIGRKNAAVLPYSILIEKGEATILAPKYYLAVSYPLLSMGDFMKISGIPGDIQDELEATLK